jgi:methylsterol monooxygenase
MSSASLFYTGANSTVGDMHQAWQQVQLSHPTLNYWEKLWTAWYAYFQNDTLATAIMTFAIHETFYFGRCLIWFFVDVIPYFRKYKIQEQKIYSAQEQWRCLGLVLAAHCFVELPEIWLFHPIATYLNVQISAPFPTLTKMATHIAVFFVMEDAWHYWVHRLMHASSFLYKNIHKIHHRYTAPFGLTAEYASPIEIMVLGLGTVGGPLIYASITKDLHILTVYIWMTLRLLQAVDSHSGYDFPWSLHNWLPFWAGAEHHDVHHEQFKGNYASSFRWWDYCLGTEAKSRKERLALAAKEGKKAQ